MEPSERVRDLVAAALGWAPSSWTYRAAGFTPAGRWVVSDGDRSAFVKVGTTPAVAGWLRTEARAYEHLPPGVAPRLLGWADDEMHPVLALEDLSQARWPPPWDRARVERVLATLEHVRAASITDVPRAGEHWAAQPGFWGRTALDAQRDPFRGVLAPAWLERNLPALIAAESAAEVDGDDLLHLDVRSDNLCFDGARTLLVDWNHVCRGNRLLDVAFWLPSLAMEGGPAPEEVLAGQPELAALVAGFFCWHAAQPVDEDPAILPRIRTFQLAQARVALPWACRLLGLEEALPEAR